MVSVTKREYEDLIKGSKYVALYKLLHRIQKDECEFSFTEIEAILGFSLPMPARNDRSWWENHDLYNGDGQSLAWRAAGWLCCEIAFEAETILFKREDFVLSGGKVKKEFNLDEFWPPHASGPWPEGLVIDREFIYGDDA